MKKQDFVLHVISQHLNIFSNKQAMEANIKDMIIQAEEVFDLVESLQSDKSVKK